jgi:hypothetical protein
MNGHRLGSDPTALFRIAAIQRVLKIDILHDVDWPLSAADALAAGVDSPLLRELAGLPPSTPKVDFREFVERVVDELGYRSPDRENARRLMAAMACVRMLDGTWTLEYGFAWIVDLISDDERSAEQARLEERFLGLRYEDDDMTFTAYGGRELQNVKAAEYEAWHADLQRRKLDAVQAEFGGCDVAALLRQATS